jgi:hypothetical protein
MPSAGCVRSQRALSRSCMSHLHLAVDVLLLRLSCYVGAILPHGHLDIRIEMDSGLL